MCFTIIHDLTQKNSCKVELPPEQSGQPSQCWMDAPINSFPPDADFSIPVMYPQTVILIGSWLLHCVSCCVLVNVTNRENAVIFNVESAVFNVIMICLMRIGASLPRTPRPVKAQHLLCGNPFVLI